MKQDVKISFGKMLLPVTLFCEKRKSISITVNPDKSVIVRAPIDRSKDAVLQHIKKRAAWILRQLDYFDRFHPIQPEKRFISGETHYYMGRQYRLKIRQGQKQQVKLVGRFFIMDIPDPTDSRKAKRLMLQWYKEHSGIILRRRIQIYEERFLRLQVSLPEIRFRRMKKRWGSYTPKGAILLNTELVKAPLDCIDYVIIHEMCHLVHPHHDRQFYKLLGRILPGWESRKERLEKVIL